MQKPLFGLWDSPRDEGQERGWQGELREEKGAVSKSSSARGPGLSFSCTSMANVQLQNRELKKKKHDFCFLKTSALKLDKEYCKRILKIQPYVLKKGKW